MNSKVLVPLLFDLTGLRILFVGAGKGTRIKLAGLADQNPKVRIVAPEFRAEVEALASRLSDAEVLRRPFADADLDGVSLVYCFTDDTALNARLADLCRARGLWSNVAQSRGPLSFTSPAIAKKDGVIAAFSSEDGQPAVAVGARDLWSGGKA
jgi:siroheme synthase-like protein